MKEEFLHYIWGYGLFDRADLRSTDGQAIQVIQSGDHNTDSGPDFFNSQVRIGETLWAGNVEIHVRSSDWKKHGHSADEAYSNVILHVVYIDDDHKSSYNGPVLELGGRIPPYLKDTYSYWLKNSDWIPCQSQISTVSEVVKESWLNRMVTNRLERKADFIKILLEGSNNNWAEAFYITLAGNFGFKVNSEPFKQLAASLPIAVLSKHKDNLDQLEALIFGQAGLLKQEFQEDYPSRLFKEYLFLKRKFKLSALDGHQWKFMRMRPSNFPTIRMAQFAMLIYQSKSLFSRILEIDDISELSRLFNIITSPYWNTHYQFEKESPFKEKQLGEASVRNILINTVVPFLFLYGRRRDEQQFIDRAVDILSKIKAEENAVVKGWKNVGLKVDSAYQSQALLELKDQYCNGKKCLNCAIGNRILHPQDD